MTGKDGWDIEAGDNNSSDLQEVQDLLRIMADKSATNVQRLEAKLALAERTLYSFERLLMVLQREPQQQTSEIDKWVSHVDLARSTVEKFQQELDRAK